MSSSRIDIKGLDKAAILAGLYNNSKVQGMGFFRQQALGSSAGQAMTIEQANKEISKTLRFDYLNGKVMKVDLSGDELDPWLYDRDNGTNAAKNVIDQIRKGYNNEFKLAEEKRLNQVEQELKKDPQEVINSSTLTIKQL